jgi:hypothetical protein
LLSFQSICLRDNGQFDTAQDLARELRTAPESMKSQLLDGQKGEIWILASRPLTTLMALIEGGCGVHIQPIRDDYLIGFTNSVPGQNIVATNEVGTSWAKWFLIDTVDNKGILLVSLLDLNGTKSADLRYVPSNQIVGRGAAQQFLLLDEATFKRIVSKIVK